jgi:hypothetical protein
MKYLSILFLFTLLISCKEESSTTPTNDSTSAEVVTIDMDTETPVEKEETSASSTNIYLSDIKSFSNTEDGNPIEKFQALAEQSAVQKIDITKENFATALQTAAGFKHIYITVENHTVVKIKDLTNCQHSKSWKTCVPYAYGYIKKGEMLYEEGYANNIIGIPDSQQRTLYLFH